MELVKNIVRVGNSAGVILPREWLNGKARVILLKKPENYKQEIMEILEQYLPSIVGLYVVGSYAREEQTESSDVDVLAITTNLNKNIKEGKYDINLISEKELENTLKDNILPLLPMLREALPLINSDLLGKYKEVKMTKHNLKWHIETSESALYLIKKSLELAHDEKEKISDNIIYSLLLRLRETYIVDCIIKNKNPTTFGLLNLIKKTSGSTEAYLAYNRSKQDKKSQRTVSIEEAESLYKYVENRLNEQREWIKTNG